MRGLKRCPGLRLRLFKCMPVAVLVLAGWTPPATRIGSVTVEPDAGVRPLVRAIDHAQDRIFVECYLLTDTPIVHALERAAAQGVQVDVLLEPHPLGMGTQPQRMADQLRAAGIAVRWTPRRYRLTHAKVMVLDDSVAVISTANFSRSGFTADRDFLIFDRDRADVREVDGIFRADWDGLTPHLEDADVVVSPVNARKDLSRLVRGARRSVDVYAEEVADRPMERALIAAHRRGAEVRVLLPPGATPQGVQVLVDGGVQVRPLGHPYGHAKMVLVDGMVAFVGSENLSTQSLDENREIGLLVRGSVIRGLAALFEADWAKEG